MRQNEEAALRSYIESTRKRYHQLEKDMAQASHEQKNYGSLSKDYAAIQPIMTCIEQIEKIEDELRQAESLKEDESDTALRALAQEEMQLLHQRRDDAYALFRRSLLSSDADDNRDVLLEIRAGTGGSEAALFAADLWRMYQRYAECHHWTWASFSLDESSLGGIKEAVAKIEGKNVYARLKYESGTHRVQRIPDTESGGRIHTSAATVAVLAAAGDIDIIIDEQDLRIDRFRSSGPGGQSVNTTDSAVRITHKPSGIVVQCQDEKSQHRNRAKAMEVLRARLHALQKQQQHDEINSMRRNQIGSGDRSERIRTYNFPQSRVTDHRTNKTLHKIEQVMSGEALDEFIDSLRTWDENQQWERVLENA